MVLLPQVSLLFNANNKLDHPHLVWWCDFLILSVSSRVYYMVHKSPAGKRNHRPAASTGATAPHPVRYEDMKILNVDTPAAAARRPLPPHPPSSRCWLLCHPAFRFPDVRPPRADTHLDEMMVVTMRSSSWLPGGCHHCHCHCS